MAPVGVVRFRAGAADRDRLARLRGERHVNVSAWLRAELRGNGDVPGREPFAAPEAVGP